MPSRVDELWYPHSGTTSGIPLVINKFIVWAYAELFPVADLMYLTSSLIKPSPLCMQATATAINVTVSTVYRCPK